MATLRNAHSFLKWQLLKNVSYSNLTYSCDKEIDNGSKIKNQMGLDFKRFQGKQDFAK